MRGDARNKMGCAVVAVWLLLVVSPQVLAESVVAEADLKAIQLVIDGQILAFKSDDYNAAYAFAAPNVKQAFPTVDIFINMVKSGYEPLYRPASYFFGRSMLSEGEVYQELIISDATRQLWQVIYTLNQQQDQSWKVSNVLMYPYQGTSA